MCGKCRRRYANYSSCYYKNRCCNNIDNDNFYNPVNKSGYLEKTCDGLETFVYDFSIPWPYSVSATNHGQCPILCDVYYVEGSTMKRVEKKINEGETWHFDFIASVVKVSITCLAIGGGCNKCSSSNDEPVCSVSWEMV